MSWERTKNRLSEYEQQKKASIYYRHDYDVSTLQSELEDKLRKLSQLNCTILFVIDELDKMEYEDVTNVIKSLKTLFNQASALFILISGEEFYRKLVNNSNQRLTEYTLFPQKIFIQRPNFSHIHEFIDKVLVESNFKDLENKDQFKKQREDYHKFKNYACYASKADYFDLYSLLRDYIIFDKDDLRLKFVLDKKLETVANLQIALEAIYLRKKLEKQSDWYKNDLLLDKMYDLITRLVERKADTTYLRIEAEPEFKLIFLNKTLQEVKDIEDKVDIKETKEGNTHENKRKQFTEMQKEAITDFINYLVRLKFLSIDGDRYRIGGILEDVPSNIKTLTKEENEFLDQYKRFRYLVIVYANLYNKYCGKPGQMRVYSYNNFNENRDLILDELVGIIHSVPTVLLSNKVTLNEIYDGLTEDIPKWYGKEKLEDNTRMLNDGCDAMFLDFIGLIESIVISRSRQVNVSKLSSLAELEKKVGVQFPADLIRESLPIDFLFMESSPDKRETRQLLLVQNPHKMIEKQIEHVKDEQDHFFALILTLNYVIPNEQIENPERQLISSEPTSNKNIWLKRLATNEIPTPNSLAEVTDVVLSWVYGTEEMEDKGVADWIAEGNRAAEVNDYQKALSKYDRALEIDSKSVQALYHKGLVYFKQGDQFSAIECYDKALEVDSTYVDALHGKGLVLYSSKKYEEALEVVDKGINIDRLEYKIWYLKGLILFTLGQYNNALEAIEQALAINPQQQQAWYYKGLALCNLTKYDDAIKSFNKVLEINPRDSEALCNIGLSLNKLQNYTEAIRSFDEALRVSPKYGEAFYGRAISNAKMNKLRNAVADLEKAIEIGKVDDRDFYRIKAKEDRLRDIKGILDRANGVQALSKSSQAYQMFSEGKSPMDAAIALDMREPEVTQLYKESWTLKSSMILIQYIWKQKEILDLLLNYTS